MSKKSSKKWVYWAVTAPVLLGLSLGGVGMLMGGAQNAEGLAHLGYPAYLGYILGTAKVLGVLAILANRFKTLKEWAYAGIVFNLLGASASHVFSGDPASNAISPLVMMTLAIVSYRLWKKQTD